MDCSLLTDCANQFLQITFGVCRVVAACLSGSGRAARLPLVVGMEVHRRVTLAQRLLLALMERVRTGRQRGGWCRVSPVLVEGAVSRASARAVVSLPRRFGWLVGLVGYQAAGHGSQLAALLDAPEMLALVRDVPQARRILRPLCRMLGVDCAGLRVVRVRRVRTVVGLAAVAGVGDLVAAADLPERVGYVSSARWPRGVAPRGPVRLKPA
jgi:hypothetical protein